VLSPATLPPPTPTGSLNDVLGEGTQYKCPPQVTETTLINCLYNDLMCAVRAKGATGWAVLPLGSKQKFLGDQIMTKLQKLLFTVTSTSMAERFKHLEYAVPKLFLIKTLWNNRQEWPHRPLSYSASELPSSHKKRKVVLTQVIPRACHPYTAHHLSPIGIPLRSRSICTDTPGFCLAMRRQWSFLHSALAELSTTLQRMRALSTNAGLSEQLLRRGDTQPKQIKQEHTQGVWLIDVFPRETTGLPPPRAQSDFSRQRVLHSKSSKTCRPVVLPRAPTTVGVRTCGAWCPVE
jgi:hypothetical protein